MSLGFSGPILPGIDTLARVLRSPAPELGARGSIPSVAGPEVALGFGISSFLQRGVTAGVVALAEEATGVPIIVPRGLIATNSIEVGASPRPIISQNYAGAGLDANGLPLLTNNSAPPSRYWWSGRYSTGASQPGAFAESGGKVFPTLRNSGLRGDALRGSQEAFSRIRLLEGRPATSIRGQAGEAGLTVLDRNTRLADPGANKAVQRAIQWYDNLQLNIGK